MKSSEQEGKGRSTNNADWRELEQLVANIQRGLAPSAKVEHNVKLIGRDTEVERQIDVLVTQQIGQYTMTIAIDCKDYKTPVDVKGIEEFAGMITDIGANKGVLVCPSGFTQTAKKLAKKRQIELYRPVDTGNHKWRVRPTLPAICEYVSAAMSFQISTIAPKPFVLKQSPAHLDAFKMDGTPLGRGIDAAMRKWNDGDYPSDEGEHRDLAIFDSREVQVDNGYGELIPVQLSVFLYVTTVRYFGQVEIDGISGFLDEQTGLTHTNSFRTGAIDPAEIENKWTKLADGEDPPIKPVLGFRGLVGWEH